MQNPKSGGRLNKEREPNPHATDTKGASIYLGGTPSESHLNKLRCIGGGPKFHKFGARVIYMYVDLDEYKAARQFSTTSEYQEKAASSEMEVA